MFKKCYFDRINSNELSGKQFFINRFSKLFPIILITTIFAYLLNFVSVYGFGASLPWGTTSVFELILCCLFAGKSIFTGKWTLINGPLWYLNVLFLLYIVSYIISKHSKKYSKLVSLFLISLGLPMIFINKEIPFFNLMIGTGLVNYFIGFIFFDVYLKINKLTNKSLVSLKIFSLILISFYFFLYYFAKSRGDSSLLAWSESGVSVLILWIPICLLLNKSKTINRFSSIRLIKFLSGISLDSFLWHIPVLNIFCFIINVAKLKITFPILLFILYFLITLIISALSNYYISTLLSKRFKSFLNKF